MHHIFIPVHEGCGDTVVLNGTQGVPQGVPQDVPQEELNTWIEEQIRKNPNITTHELAHLSGKGVRTIKRRIQEMPHIKYVGSGYSGHWEIADVK